MALIQVSHTWADGSTLTVTARSKGKYPDHLNQLRAEAKRMWCEALAELEGVAEAKVESVEVPEA